MMAKHPLPRAVPAAPADMMSDATRERLKRRFRIVLLIDAVCVFVAFASIYAHVTLRQAWGLPLFVLAMVVGFGVQIAFIVGLVKASRSEKGA